MSWSLQIKNGDLVLDQRSLGTVTGPQKLVQDIRCAILERMGTDDLHPEYGSILDGGTTPDGREFDGIIGETDPDLVKSYVTNEINRIMRNHQSQQIDRAKQDRLTYNKTTLVIGEIIDDFSVDIATIQGSMVVRINLVSKAGTESTIVVPYVT